MPLSFYKHWKRYQLGLQDFSSGVSGNKMIIIKQKPNSWPIMPSVSWGPVCTFPPEDSRDQGDFKQRLVRRVYGTILYLGLGSKHETL